MEIAGFQTNLSTRGIPLLYVGKPLDKPVVTLENYDKWYRAFLVMPNGSVVEKNFSDLDYNDPLLPGSWWVDHIIHPRALYALAKQVDGYTEERSLEVATARWILENQVYEKLVEQELFDSPEEF